MRKLAFLLILLAVFSLSGGFFAAYVEADDTKIDHLRGQDLTKINWQAKDIKFWEENLGKLQYKVARKGGTEYAFTGKYNKEKRAGIYHCSSCGLELYDSKAKFDSGTGWPSFYQPINDTAIKEVKDTSYGMLRVETRCARCDAHLGHVFTDGPEPTGLRHCINSVSLVHSEDLKQ